MTGTIPGEISSLKDLRKIELLKLELVIYGPYSLKNLFANSLSYSLFTEILHLEGNKLHGALRKEIFLLQNLGKMKICRRLTFYFFLICVIFLPSQLLSMWVITF